MILAVPPADHSKFLIISVVAIIFGLLVAGILESKILLRLGWTTAAKAAGFVAANNIITPVLAFVFLAAAFAFFSIFGVKNFTNFEENGTRKMLVYLLFPVLIMILRRQMLASLKIRSDIWSYVYAFVSTKITFWLMFISILVFYELLK